MHRYFFPRKNSSSCRMVGMMVCWSPLLRHNEQICWWATAWQGPLFSPWAAISTCWAQDAMRFGQRNAAWSAPCHCRWVEHSQHHYKNDYFSWLADWLAGMEIIANLPTKICVRRGRTTAEVWWRKSISKDCRRRSRGAFKASIGIPHPLFDRSYLLSPSATPHQTFPRTRRNETMVKAG